jgi:hypothetical protein
MEIRAFRSRCKYLHFNEYRYMPSQDIYLRYDRVRYDALVLESTADKTGQSNSGFDPW